MRRMIHTHLYYDTPSDLRLLIYFMSSGDNVVVCWLFIVLGTRLPIALEYAIKDKPIPLTSLSLLSPYKDISPGKTPAVPDYIYSEIPSAALLPVISFVTLSRASHSDQTHSQAVSWQHGWRSTAVT